MTQTANQIINLCKQMRAAQRDYFRDRDPQALSVARELERRVDRAIEEYENKQPKLF